VPAIVLGAFGGRALNLLMDSFPQDLELDATRHGWTRRRQKGDLTSSRLGGRASTDGIVHNEDPAALTVVECRSWRPYQMYFWSSHCDANTINLIMFACFPSQMAKKRENVATNLVSIAHTDEGTMHVLIVS